MPYFIVGTVLTAVLAVAGIVLLWSFRTAFYQPTGKKHPDPRKFFGEERDRFCYPELVALVNELEARPYEAVSIVSHDGLKLTGRFYAAPDSDVVEILFHGWRGCALRDGCGGSHLAKKAGHNLLLVDQRAHGDSEGNVITFGILEKYDCLDWVNYAVERLGPDIKILLSGVSMGAATVLMASALPLPQNVRGILADCGYSSPEAIIRKVCRDMKIPDQLGYPFVRISARLFGHFSLRDGGAVEAVKHTKIPILIIHGKQDGFVPHAMCREIYDACASDEKVLVEIEEASHGLAYFYDRARYESAVLDFQTRVLNDLQKTEKSL